MADNVSTKLVERVARRHFQQFTPALRQRFLRKLEETTDVQASADACGLSALWLRTQKKIDPEFSAEWEAALDRAFDPRLYVEKQP